MPDLINNIYFCGIIDIDMKLSNEWFTALSENESGQLVTVSGRDN